MSRKLLIIIGIIALLAGVGAFIYLRWTEAQQKVNLWTLVPHDAVLIWESNDNNAFFDHLKTTDIWETVSQARYVQQLQENLAELDSTSGQERTLGNFLKNKPVLTSLHVVNNNDFDLVFYVPVNNVNEHRYMRTIIESLEKSERYSFSNREYQGHQLTDIRNAASGKELSYFTYRNNIVLSSSPNLIEEIVRNIERGVLTSPAGEMAGTGYISQPDVWANVWLNYKQIPVFLSLFLTDRLHNDLTFLFSLCRSGMLELKLSEDKLLMNGFSEPDTTGMAMGSQMRMLSSQPLSLSNVVPARAAMVVFFGGEKLRLQSEETAKPLPEDKALTLLADSIRRQIGNEIAFCLLDTYNPSGNPDKLLFAKVSRANVLGPLLEEAEKQLSPGIETETFSGKPIRLLNSAQLPQRIFGSLFKGFEQTYFYQTGDYVVMAEDLHAMRALLIDISNESVWGKSVAQKAFLEQAQQDANLSIFVNTVNSWNMLLRYLDPERKQDVVKNASLVKRFSQLSMQFSRQENQYYTSIILRHQFPRGAAAQNLAFEEITSTTFATKLFSQPYPAQNPANKSPEVLLQDSAFALHLVTAEGKKIWHDSIGAQLIGPVKMVTGKSGMANYIFATSNQIFSIDREGKYGINYPFNLSDSVQLKHLTVADHGGKGDYSYIAADFRGDVYWFDQSGNLLEGWQPRRLGQPLAAAPIYLRVGGQPVILTILDNGNVLAFNRYGETFPGFPFSLKAATRGGTYMRIGPSLAKTTFTVVTVSGEVITFNLLGDIVRREQMVKASRSSRFELVPEHLGNSYLLARQDLGKLTLYDPDLRVVLEKSYVTSAPKDIQYFHFGADRKLYVIVERGPQKTYLYEASGQLLGKRPVQNVHPLDVKANEAARTYQFFIVNGNKLQLLSANASD